MALRTTCAALIVAGGLPLLARAEAADVRVEPDLRPDLRTLAVVTLQDQQPPKQQGGSGQTGAQQGGGQQQGSGDQTQPSTDAAKTGEPSLDFDLLGEAKAPPVPPEDRSLSRRRKMLGVHQAVGLFALVPLQLGTTVVGQLNYNDKFGDANTGRYKLSHQVLAYSTLAVFAANGAIALLAPEPASMQHRGFDRVTLHKVSMFTAAAGMAAQAALGIYTARREGFENKQDFGTAHLAVGYVTLAAVLAGVSAIVF